MKSTGGMNLPPNPLQSQRRLLGYTAVLFRIRDAKLFACAHLVHGLTEGTLLIGLHVDNVVFFILPRVVLDILLPDVSIDRRSVAFAAISLFHRCTAHA